MSRQRIRDERRGQPRDRGQPEPQRKGGEARPDDLGVGSRAGGREEPARLQEGSPGEPVQEAQARLVAERRDGPAVRPRREPREEPRPELPAQRAAEREAEPAEQPPDQPPTGNASELLGQPPAVRAEGPTGELRQEAAEATVRRWLEEGLITPVQARAVGRLIGDGDPSPEVLGGLVESGILTRSQAAAVGRAQRSNGRSLVPVAGGRPARSGAELGHGKLGVRLPRPSPDARRLGVFLAAIAFVGLVWAGFSLLTDALGTPRHPGGVALLDSLRLLASVLALVGGRRMYRGMQSGKALVLVALMIYALASVLLAVRRLADPVVIVLLVSWALLYYLTAVSRFGPAQSSPAAPGPR